MFMWNDIEVPWQLALELAWEAYREGTVPIGAVIVNGYGNVVSKGRNRIFDLTDYNQLSGTNMAHAEMNALLGLKGTKHPNIREYILYTSMEPCPMCFGTAIMMNIRNIYYGARDGFAGAAELNHSLDYIRKKNMNIKYEGGEVEAFQLILQSAYEYRRKHPRIEEILSSWRDVNHRAIELGKELHEMGYFDESAIDVLPIESVYNFVIDKYEKGSN